MFNVGALTRPLATPEVVGTSVCCQDLQHSY